MIDRLALLFALALLSVGAAGGLVGASAQSPPPPPATRPDDTSAAALKRAFANELERIAASLDGVMGYVVVDLTSGDRFGRLQDTVFPTASTIKLAILYELFRQAEEGAVRLDDSRPMDASHVVGGSGILRELRAPAMPLRDYATLMIVLSDNTATNLLIDALGMQNVTRRVESLGLSRTRLRRRMMDIDAARRGDENVSTPGEIARLLEVLERGEGLRPESREQLLAILAKEKSSPITRGLPSGTRVASKPGTLEGVAVDAGIVYLEGRPYIVSAMTTFLKSGDAGATAVERVSRSAFDYFSRLASSSEYGRRIR